MKMSDLRRYDNIVIYNPSLRQIKTHTNKMKFLSKLPIIEACLSTNESSWVVVVVAPKMHNL
jgi:hypothetical protein